MNNIKSLETILSELSDEKKKRVESAESVKSKFSTNNFKKIRIQQFSETRFGSFVGLFSCFDVYKP